MAYKKLIKVSNVCQLLDKSKYPATQTGSGVTFTNNGDGTITANGTATGLCQYRITNRYKKLIGENTNKCLLVGSISANSGTPYYLQLDFLEGNSWSRAELDFGKGVIFTNSYSSTQLLSIIVKSGVTVNNLVFKPQIFDLTEMYGAGHEPTSVEQFRQDFPNELYDYSPHCWLTSYKRVFLTGGGNYLTSYQRNLTCKTKNLFDINSAVKISGGSYFSKNGNQITVSTNGTYHYISANVLLDTSLVGKTVTFSTYAKTSDKNTAYLRIQWLAPNGLASKNLIESNTTSGQAYQKVSLTGIVPVQPDDEHNMLCLSFYSDGPNTTTLPSKLYTVVYTDIQLELGDTATDYVPYGHL